jgi:subtilisin family serine protease
MAEVPAVTPARPKPLLWPQAAELLFPLQQRSEQAAVPVSAGDPAQYALARLRLPQAHTLAKGDKVLIAVIDSAIDTTHPELNGMVVKTYDALGEKPHAHGTAVAGAIVANAKLMGVAPQAASSV